MPCPACPCCMCRLRCVCRGKYARVCDGKQSDWRFSARAQRAPRPPDVPRHACHGCGREPETTARGGGEAERGDARVASAAKPPGAHKTHGRSENEQPSQLSLPPSPLPNPQEDLVSPIDRRSDFYRRRAWESGPPSRPASPPPPDAPRRSPLVTLPNVLTFFRLALVPVLGALWFVDAPWAPPTVAAVFIGAALTDWADGYLARRLAITSAFGAFLDPVADKVMVATTLILVAAQPPPPLTVADATPVAAVIVCREVAMSALREWAAACAGGGARAAVKVNSLGKWKTALQMVAMSGLLLLRGPALEAASEKVFPPALALCVRVSFAALWAGAILGAVSLHHYMAAVWHFFEYPGGVPPAAVAAAAAVPSPPKVAGVGRRASSRLASK